MLCGESKVDLLLNNYRTLNDNLEETNEAVKAPLGNKDFNFALTTPTGLGVGDHTDHQYKNNQSSEEFSGLSSHFTCINRININWIYPPRRGRSPNATELNPTAVF